MLLRKPIKLIQISVHKLHRCPAAEVEQTKPICKIGEIVYILKIIYLILKLLVRNQYKL